MRGRLSDAIRTLLQPGWDRRLRALELELAADRTEVRSLISEMDDVLEKFSRVVARQAKRRGRDMRDALEEGPVAPAVPESTDRKTMLRRRLRENGGRPPWKLTNE